MKSLLNILALVCMLAYTTSAFASATLPGMSIQGKTDSFTGVIPGGSTIKLALGLSSANTTLSPATTTYSSFTDLGTSVATGYTTGGATVSGISVVATSGATAPSNSSNAACTASNAPYGCCTGSGTGTCNPRADLTWTPVVWTLPSSGATSLAADLGCLYNTNGHIIAIFALSGTVGTNVTASGNSATLTVSSPTVSNSQPGGLYAQ